MRLIDADAIDYDEYWNRNGEGFTIDVCQKAQRIIDEQPTIPSAEAVQGEWIRKNYHTYICNQCGYEEAIYGNVEEYRFCSHCGARMYKGGDTE